MDCLLDRNARSLLLTVFSGIKWKAGRQFGRLVQ